MKKRMIIFSLILFILSGCSGVNKSEEGHVGIPTPQMIEVQLTTGPERLMPNEPVNIIAKVTLEGESVENADEVTFEIWEEGHQEQSEKIAGKHKGEGIYSITKTFAEKGVYYVVSHVTLREMHNMPRLKLVVGDVPGEKPTHEQVDHDQEMNHGESH
jgi:hypothetical protein